MSDKFTFSSAGAVHELEMAMDRVGGWNAALVKRLSTGDHLAHVREYLLGQAGIKHRGLLSIEMKVSVGDISKFVPKDHLQAANVGWTGENFKKFFLDKVEENVPAGKLAVHRLKKASLDTPILAELGNRAEISLAQLFELIKRQAKGQKGALLTNGNATIAHIRDSNGELWIMFARWQEFCRYWDVGACSVGDSGEWSAGDQVLSRK